MLVPGSGFQLLAVLLLVVPGIVYASVRRRLTGPTPEDRDFSVRIARAIVVSIMLDLGYLMIWGSDLVEGSGIRTSKDKVDITGFAKDIADKAVVSALLLLVVPATLGFVAHVDVAWLRRPSWRRSPLRRIDHPTPNAWSRRATERGECFVRIFTSDGYWVGGWVSEQAYVSTYPEPRDIFIDVEYAMDSKGHFQHAIEGSLGVFVPLAGSERVAWLEAPRADDAHSSA